MSGAWVDLRDHVPGLRGHRVHVLPASLEPLLRQGLAEAGFETVTLLGSAIRNEAAFFDEMARALSLPEWFGRGWDALADVLRDDDTCAGPRHAILWVDADQSAAADLQTFVSALVVLDAAARDLASLDAEAPPRQLAVFVLGGGPGFSPGR